MFRINPRKITNYKTKGFFWMAGKLPPSKGQASLDVLVQSKKKKVEENDPSVEVTTLLASLNERMAAQEARLAALSAENVRLHEIIAEERSTSNAKINELLELVKSLKEAVASPKPVEATPMDIEKELKASYAAVAATKPPPQPRPKRHRQLTPEELVKVFQGENPRKKKENRLTTIFISGIRKILFQDLKDAMESIGVQRQWVRHISWVANDVIQLVVFIERAEEIAKKLDKHWIVRHLPNYDILDDIDPIIVKQRIETELENLPQGMHMVRRVLETQLKSCAALCKTSSTTDTADTAGAMVPLDSNSKKEVDQMVL